MMKLIDRMRKNKIKDNSGNSLNEASKPESQCSQDEDDSIPTSLLELRERLAERIGFNASYDINFREMVFGNVNTGFLCLNGITNDDLISEVIQRLSYVSQSIAEINTPETFEKLLIPHTQVKPYRTLKEVLESVLTGSTAIFIEGEETALIVDIKNFPTRTTAEPDLERVVRGARDGFVEAMLTNTTLVRRRIRDPKLRFETTQVGRRTRTDVCIGYIKDIADPVLVDAVTAKIKNVSIDGLPLAEKQLEEAVIEKNRWSPYPLVRYSERPDVIAAHILEGHVTVFVDTSPSVMIIPSTFFHHLQHAEEFREAPVIGTFLRWVRFIGIIVSLFLLPLWYLLVVHPELRPALLSFIGPKKMSDIPLLAQFLIAELGIDLMRMASVHTPSPLAIAMGLVAAIMIGDVAVKSGLFVNEVILFLSVAVLGTFATPSYELSLANRVVRLALLIAVAVFGAPGLIVGTTLWIIYLATLRSYNTPYLWPFLPFNAKALLSILVRLPVRDDKKRPSIVKPMDNSKQEK